MPGMIEHTMRMAPKDSRILIVGACMQREDHIHPMLGTEAHAKILVQP